MSGQSFVLISLFSFCFFFLSRTGALISFRTLCKNCYKTQTCHSIVSIFGTSKVRIKVHLRTKFAMNLINIQGVMSVYSRKKDESFVMATG